MDINETTKIARSRFVSFWVNGTKRLSIIHACGMSSFFNDVKRFIFVEHTGRIQRIKLSQTGEEDLIRIRL